MKIAIPVYQDRLSPVFDSTCLMKVFTTGEFPEMKEEDSVSVNSSFPHVRIEKLLSRGVNLIICAAISRECQAILMGKGVRVLAGFSGNVEEILKAFGEHRLHEKRFRLPCWRVMPCCRFRAGKRRSVVFPDKIPERPPKNRK